MKSVKGEVLSSAPISISKAASILSKFVSADTGASQAVCAYLRRASASFNELSQLHKELRSNRKHKSPKSDTVAEDGKPIRSVSSNHPERSRGPVGPGVSEGDEGERKKHKKKKKKDGQGWFGDLEKSEGKLVQDKVGIKNEENELVVETEKKKHKKKMDEYGNLEGGEGRLKVEEDGNVGMENERKKNKKREVSEFEIGNLKENVGLTLAKEERKEERKEKRKRKSEEIEEGRETNSEEYRSKKKKKKSKGELKS